MKRVAEPLLLRGLNVHCPAASSALLRSSGWPMDARAQFTDPDGETST